METQSEVMVEVHVLAAEDMSKGISNDGAVVGDNPCKDLVLVTTKEREAALTEECTLAVMKDDQTEIEKCTMMLQTQSQVMVEVHVQLAAEEVSKGEGDDGAVVGDNLCNEDLVLGTMKVQEAVLTEESVPPVMTIDDQTEIEKSTLMLHSLIAPGDGDGEAPAEDANGTPLSASQAEITELPCKEVTPELVLAKEQEGCNGDGDVKLTDETSLPEFLPVSEDNEPAWGDVPDDIPVEPILPPRPPKRPRVAPECVEVDDVVQTMRNILFNLTYADDAPLSPEDEAKVRDLLEYHPKAEEKIGSGIEFIKIKRHSTYKDVRCFWVVRTDGTETDFSYHKCLKEKVAKENPSFVARYDAIYRAPKRPRMI